MTMIKNNPAEYVTVGMVQDRNRKDLLTHIRPTNDSDSVEYAYKVCATGDDGSIPVYRHVLPCPFCEGDPAPLDENDHTSCTTVWCGSTAYMHVDAWNNRPMMGALSRIAELEAELGGWSPIEDAPKDGAKVDLWVIFDVAGARRVPDAHWNDKLGDWQLGQHNAADYMVHPVITHFMMPPGSPNQSPEEMEA